MTTKAKDDAKVDDDAKTDDERDAAGDRDGAGAASDDDLSTRVESILRTALPKVLDELYPEGGDDGDDDGDDSKGGDNRSNRRSAAVVEADVERRVREELARVTTEKERDEALKVLGEKVAKIERPPMALRKLTRAIWGGGDNA